MAVLCLLCVSFLSSLSPCSWAALPLCVLYPCHGDAKYLHISVLQVQVQTYSVFSYVVILTSGSAHVFFLLLLLTAIFQAATDVPPPLELTAIGVRHRSCGCLTSSLGGMGQTGWTVFVSTAFTRTVRLGM